MIPGPREWLPPEAMDCGAVRGLVAGAVGLWASKWFARADTRPVAFEARPGTAMRAIPGWRVGLAVGTASSSAETVRLAGLALGAEPERLVLSDVDRDLIGRFAAGIADDLTAAIEAALELDPTRSVGPAATDDPFSGQGGLQFGIADDGGKMLLQVAIPTAALVPFRKSAIASRSRRAAPLARVDRAFEATPVRIRAGLGQAALPLSALAGLAAGDVIVLDRAIDDGAALSLRSSGRIFARGAIIPGDAEVSLLLSPQ